MIHRCMLNVTKKIHHLHMQPTELIEYNSNGLNQNNHLVIGNTVIDTQPCVTNLGCVLDVGLVMSGHAARMCKSAYHYLRCIIRK